MPRAKRITEDALVSLSTNELQNPADLQIDYSELDIRMEDMTREQRAAAIDLANKIIEYSASRSNRDSILRDIQDDQYILGYAAKQTSKVLNAPIPVIRKIPFIGSSITLSTMAIMPVGWLIYDLHCVLSNVYSLMSKSDLGFRGVYNALGVKTIKEDYILKALFKGVENPMIYIDMVRYGFRETASTESLKDLIDSQITPKVTEGWTESIMNMLYDLPTKALGQGHIAKNTVAHFRVDLNTAIDSTEDFIFYMRSIIALIAAIFFVFAMYGAKTRSDKLKNREVDMDIIELARSPSPLRRLENFGSKNKGKKRLSTRPLRGRKRAKRSKRRSAKKSRKTKKSRKSKR